jgi:dipeptidase E
VQPFRGGPSHVYQFISGSTDSPMCGLGWKSLGVLELTALPSIKPDYWVQAVQEADALLVWGGSPLYLCYWMRHSGLADLLPSLRPETVYVGTSGGAMVATPDFGGVTYDQSELLTSSDQALGLVEFSVFPHESTHVAAVPTERVDQRGADDHAVCAGAGHRPDVGRA